MSTTNNTYEIKAWDEKTYDEISKEAKLTRASVTYQFNGSIEGEGHVEYLMAYPGGEDATYVGLLRVIGSVRGRKGSFVAHISGQFSGGIAKDTWIVVENSGTDDLQGLKGTGHTKASHGQHAEYTFDYEYSK
jgi:hypothetical protein